MYCCENLVYFTYNPGTQDSYLLIDIKKFLRFYTALKLTNIVCKLRAGEICNDVNILKFCTICNAVNVFCPDPSVVQSTLTHTLINSAYTGLTVEGLAPVLDHVTITECGDVGIDYKPRGWGLLTMLECNVSRNSYSPLTVESYFTDAAVYLYRCA